MIDWSMPIGDYLASRRISHHKLRTFATGGPRAYFVRHEQHQHAERDTEAFTTGRAMEDALQRPEDFRRLYVAKPDGMSFARGDGKEWRAEQLARGLTILDSEDARGIEALLGTLECCPIAQALIRAAAVQPTLYTAEGRPLEWSALPGLQSRPDWLCLEGCAASDFRPYALDLKTTNVLGQLANGRSILRYGYHRQAGLVRMLLGLEGVDLAAFRYLILGAEKAFPHRWRVFELPRYAIDRGEVWCRYRLSELAECYETGEWPLVPSEITLADVPDWGEESEAAE